MQLICKAFECPAWERVRKLRLEVPTHIGLLERNQRLAVGIPDPLGRWDSSPPLAYGPGEMVKFWRWLQEHEAKITNESLAVSARHPTSFFIAVIPDGCDLRDPIHVSQSPSSMKSFFEQLAQPGWALLGAD